MLTKGQKAKTIDVGLSQIGNHAVALEKLFTKCVMDLPSTENMSGEQCEALEDVAHTLTAMRALVQQIGWMADMYNEGIGVMGDACNWMMPPIFHDRIEPAH